MVYTGVPKKRLLMVMPYSQFVRKAAEAGFEVWAIWDPSLRDRAYLDEVAEHARELLLTDFSDEQGLRDLIAGTARAHAIETVLHLGSEESMGPAVAAAEALGLSPNAAGAVHRLNDKAAMRALLAESGLSVVRAEPAATAEEVAAVAGRLPLPVVVKPSHASGSRGVALIRDGADLQEWSARVESSGLAGPFLVEEYLEGPEFSVETLSAGGTHHVIGITAKQTTGAPGFVETSHIHPAQLDPSDASAIRAVVTGLLDLAGYTFGPAHTEVILTAGGPRIVESQTRLGGDRIPLLIETATDFDIEAEIFRTLAGAPVRPPRPKHTAAIGFFFLTPGRLESVTGLGAIRALPYVHQLHFPFAPGDELPRTTDSFTRHGYVVVDAQSPAEATERIARARALLRADVRESVTAAPIGALL
ncbi:ATP-grasp domain-containing protein [Streptomyces antarcticus]|uniref:ATP-grasp domain-containing protein n=1 Tax=Streptomyces antarcticus TaxID=2996458 RepID=UPI00226E476C|nr:MULTISPECIES: ATP-grasp domain-containing protein [unclassified Streptomyces]MCY0942948.1 ATP-grasp domain-containing protein [Streptomyces sp. H34-AA3]MCZ4083092.1 ATP-grasp domain-containing protein [Streptomyces sp. H34-S5]